MLVKTRGIVLSHINYAETSIIVHIYTEELGRQAYIVNSVRSAKKKNLLALLQPLTILDLEVYHKNKKELHRIKELKIHWPFKTIPFHPVRRAIAFFITELLTKSLREEEANDHLFQYLMQSIQALDEGIPGENNFHLYFMLQLTRFLGFFPQEIQKMPYFDLQNGRFSTTKPNHNHYLTDGVNQYWKELLNTNLNNIDQQKWNTTIRQQLIDSLETFYQLQLPGFGHLKSHHVLHQIF